MKIKNILFSIALLFCVILPTGTNAQTAYQNKCKEIYIKYYSIFTYGRVQNLSTEEKLTISMTGDYGITLLFYNAMMEAVYKNPQSAEKILKKMEVELKQAESLMTPEERYRHTMSKSSYGVLKMTIRDKINVWATKGEFETTDQYNARLEHHLSEEFRKSCENTIPNPTYIIHPLKYNADNGTYSFEITYTIKFEGDGNQLSLGLTGQSKDIEFSSKVSAYIPIDIKIAQKIKNNDIDAEVVSCIWGRKNDTIYPQRLTLAIGDNQYTIETGVSDLIILGEEIGVEKVSLNGLSYNYTQAESTRILRQTVFPQLIIKYNDRLSTERDSANNLIKQSPYYLRLRKREAFLIKDIAMNELDYSSESEIENEYKKNHLFIQNELQKALSGMRIELRKDKDQYIDVLRKQNPYVVDSLETEYPEYRCHYPTFADFIIAFEDKLINPMDGDCRSQAKLKYIHLFETENEFNVAYNKGDSYLIGQVKKRQAQKEYLQYFENEGEFNMAYDRGTTSFNDLVNKRREYALRLVTFEEYLYTPYKSDKLIGQQKLKGAAQSSTQNIKQVADLFSVFKDDTFSYNKAALILLKVNEKMNNEFVENGMYFSSTSEFVESYLSEEYKSILKQKKKDAKK